MSSFKSLLVLLALGAVGYGVYRSLHTPYGGMPTGVDQSTPAVELQVDEPIPLPGSGKTFPSGMANSLAPNWNGGPATEKPTKLPAQRGDLLAGKSDFPTASESGLRTVETSSATNDAPGAGASMMPPLNFGPNAKSLPANVAPATTLPANAIFNNTATTNGVKTSVAANSTAATSGTSLAPPPSWPAAAPDLAQKGTSPLAAGDTAANIPGSTGVAAATASANPAPSAFAAVPLAGTPLPAAPFTGINSATATPQPGEIPVNSNLGQSPTSFPAASLNVAAPSPAATAPAVPLGPSPFTNAMADVQPLLVSRRLPEALAALTELYGDPRLTAVERQHLQDLLNQLAGTVIYSREHWLHEPHTVAPGENLERIAQQYQVPWELLAKINGLQEPNQVQPGQQLKVIPGRFTAVIHLEQKKLTMMLHEYYAGSFDLVALGQESQYKEDTLAVFRKAYAPEYKSAAGTIPGKDQRNPLGNFLLALSNDLVIHGTHAEIPPTDPRGSIRMSERDIEDVYDLLDVGSRVTLKR